MLPLNPALVPNGNTTLIMKCCPSDMLRRLRPGIFHGSRSLSQFPKNVHTVSRLKWPLGEHQRVEGRELSRFSDQLLDLQSYWKPIYETRNYKNNNKVIHPIGWDAFGLPAENAARERGVDPREWTLSNIESMKKQLLQTGIIFDWDRELSTCHPSYYRWTQWIFLRLHERGLLRRNLAEVNWDPVDNTVLAAEQIDSEGRSWRSGAIAEKRKLRQWMVETPRYAKDDQHQPMEEVLDLRVADPIAVSRAAFIVVRQGHPLSDDSRTDVHSPLRLFNRGFQDRLGISVLNGVSGVWMPVIVVPQDYDGPEMHLDARCGDMAADSALVEQFKITPDRRSIMSMNVNDVQEIAAFGRYGGYVTSRTLQDWVVSRQRAWGTPIPMILSADGKTAVPLADHELPLLQGHEAGKKVACDRLKGGEGFYESDTLDTFFDSAWYYLRYLDPTNESAPLSKEAAARMPVDIYVGGIEHAAVHMFFARFISYFLTDIGLTQEAEPFRNLIPQGIVRGKTYVDSSGKYVPKEEVAVKENKYFAKDGGELNVVFEKMSKSKRNGVDPLDVLERNGVDMTRLQLLDSAAPRQAINWEELDQKGLRKWLDRVAWIISAYVDERKKAIETQKETPINSKLEENLRENYNFFVRNTSMCLEVLNLHNTALARLQGFTNALRKIDPSVFGSSPEAERCIYALITMMQVYTPYCAAEMWAALLSVPPIRASVSSSCLLDEVPWPQVDPDCDIDFILTVNEIGCGRVAVPRQELEHLSLEKLTQRARSQEHRDVLERLSEKNFTVKSIMSSSREGFHVTLNVTLEGEVDPRDISQILNDLSSKWKAMSKKRKRAEAKA
ncbi:hypothetical protein ANCCEY_14037 [Ancylostoma ceylanicum]|uniref:leucine--tRNA ligase n=1 Tax=Ancylostoma ceylanicum TaxID=53326 RepID=A0A0D6L683_9BILA|nr:hypothetical protein ANCCEY_14037 [Ancylostoma ceylanicum]